MQISFTILGKPMGKERPRMAFNNGKTYVYTPNKTKDYESNVRTSYAKTIRHKFPKGMPLEANVTAFYRIPTNTSEVLRKAMLNGDILPTCKPDGDNIIKIILDSLNKVAFHDDSQVCKINFEKRYSFTPKVCVKIRNLEGLENEVI